MASGIRRRS